MRPDPTPRQTRVIEALEHALEDAEAVRDYKAVLDITARLKELGVLHGEDDEICSACGHSPYVEQEIEDLVRELRARG